MQNKIRIHQDSWTCSRVQRVVAAICYQTKQLDSERRAHCYTFTRFLPISRSTELSCATTSHPEVAREIFQWNVSSGLSRCLFHSVRTIINICETQWRNAAAVVVMNTPEFNQTWLQRAAFTVYFLRRAGGGAGVPVIYYGNALIMHAMHFLFSFRFIYHSKVILRSWFSLRLSVSTSRCF